MFDLNGVGVLMSDNVRLSLKTARVTFKLSRATMLERYLVVSALLILVTLYSSESTKLQHVM